MEKERFRKPTGEEITEFAIVFNQGKIEREKLYFMVGMCKMLIDRLYDNGDILAKSQNEIEIESNHPQP